MLSLSRYILFPLLLNPSIVWHERANLPEPRAGYIAGVFNGKLMIAGGSYWSNDQKIYSARSDVFDPELNKWLPLPNLPAPRSDAACATLAESVYAFGGVVDGKLSNSVVRLDHQGWSTVPQATLPVPLMYGIATTVDSKVLLFGGLTELGNLSSASRELLEWQAGGMWRKLAEFPGLPRVTAAVAGAGGKLYVFGGVHASKPGAEIDNLDDAWSYDRSLDRWTREAKLPVARRAWSAITVNDHILLIGGYTSNFSNEIYSFDIRTKKTNLVGKLPHPLADAKYVRIGNDLFTAGGESAIKVRGHWTIQGTLGGTSQ